MMESVRIRQQIRPHRFAFVVKHGDLRMLAEVASVNTILWGGIFNPFVSLKRRLRRRESDELRGILKDFDPDFLVNYSSVALPHWLAEQFEGAVLQKAEFEVAWRENVLARKGVDILPLLRHAWREETRLAGGRTNVLAVELPKKGPWRMYGQMVFGAFPTDLGVDYRQHFNAALRATVVQMPADLRRAVDPSVFVPIRFTAYQLETPFGGVWPYYLIFVANATKFEDLLDFWNLRATGRDVLLLPHDNLDPFSEVAKLLIERGVSAQERGLPRIQVVKSSSVNKDDFESVCNWLGSLTNVPFARAAWIPEWGMEFDRVAKQIEVGACKACEHEEMSHLEDGKLSPIRTTLPSYLQEATQERNYSWSVILDLSETYDDDYTVRLPRGAGVEKLARRGMVASLHGEARLAQEGIVVHQTSPGFVYARAVPTIDVFRGLFEGAGLRAEPSRPGRYAQRIIDHMGGIDGCRVFKVRGVREALFQMRNGRHLEANEIVRIIGQRWLAEYNDLILFYPQPVPLTPVIVFDHMVAKKLVRPGLTFECLRCGKEEWHHIDEVSESVKCPYCFHVQDAGRLDRKRWFYKTNGILMLPKEGEGSIPVVLGLWRLKHAVSLWTAKYSTALMITPSGNGKESEIDFAFLNLEQFRNRHDLALGEARGHVNFRARDINKLMEVGRRFATKPFLVFVTLRDEFSADEKKRLRALVDKGWRVIALTRHELDPYDLFDRFSNAPHKHAVSLRELSDNTVALNLR